MTSSFPATTQLVDRTVHVANILRSVRPRDPLQALRVGLELVTETTVLLDTAAVAATELRSAAASLLTAGARLSVAMKGTR